MLRILRGLAGRALHCGCLLGVYETYDGKTIAIVDAKGSDCKDPAHLVNTSVDIQLASESMVQPPTTIPTMMR